MIALLLCAALMQDSAMVVGPVYRNAPMGIELPRPFDDWVFSPETDRGTTTVIFHPRDVPLGDQLWGVLILSAWDGPPPLGDLADRRIAGTWRRAYGSSFELLSRDTVALAGLTAIRLRMSGNIERAVVDVEEYLVGRGTDFILLQLRYPRGLPRDSIAAGYERTIRGLRLRSQEPVASTDPLAPQIENGQIVFQVPAGMRAITAGELTAELLADGRRTMRYRPPVETARPLYAVGRYTPEQMRRGRLTVRVWRSGDRAIGVSERMIDVLASGWSSYWRAFGAVPLAELTVVETSWPNTLGGPGIVFVGQDANDTVLLRELSRTWWGGFARSREPLAPFLNDWLPDWSPVIAGIRPGDSTVSVIERLRADVGDALFRQAVRTLAGNARHRDTPVAEFFAMLGPAASPVRTAIR